MSHTPDAPPALQPRPGRSGARRVAPALRRLLTFSLSALLALVVGPGGLAASCAGDEVQASAAGCCAVSCDGCGRSAGERVRPAGGTDDVPASPARCGCEVRPASAPSPEAVSHAGAVERPDSRAASAFGALTAPSVGVSSGGDGPGPERGRGPGRALFLRNCVFRI